MRLRTLSGAPATSPGRWVLIVGALTSGAIGQSGGAPDSHYSLSGAPFGAALTSARAGAHCSVAVDRWRCSRFSAWRTGQSGATPDSPVNYSGGQFQKPEGGKFGVILPGAPDTVRCLDQGNLRLSFALFI